MLKTFLLLASSATGSGSPVHDLTELGISTKDHCIACSHMIMPQADKLFKVGRANEGADATYTARARGEHRWWG